MLAQRAFLDGAETEDRRARALVARARLELDAVIFPLLEGEAQHEILRLSIDVCSLEVTRDPCPTDLRAFVLRRDVREPTAADDALRRAIDRREGHRGALMLPLQRRLDVEHHVVAVPHARRRVFPDLGVEPHLAQRVDVREVERLEDDA